MNALSFIKITTQHTGSSMFQASLVHHQGAHLYKTVAYHFLHVTELPKTARYYVCICIHEGHQEGKYRLAIQKNKATKNRNKI